MFIEGDKDEDSLTAGTEESVLRAMMPKDTDIKTIGIPQDKNATDIIEEYRSNNYMILATYKVDKKDYNYDQDYHCVLYDNRNKKLVSTYDPNNFDSSVATLMI